MAKVNATTNGRENKITFISQLYHISDNCNNFVTFTSLYCGCYKDAVGDIPGNYVIAKI
jgi:hypothetical protein